MQKCSLKRPPHRNSQRQNTTGRFQCAPCPPNHQLSYWGSKNSSAFGNVSPILVMFNFTSCAFVPLEEVKLMHCMFVLFPPQQTCRQCLQWSGAIRAASRTRILLGIRQHHLGPCLICSSCSPNPGAGREWVLLLAVRQPAATRLQWQFAVILRKKGRINNSASPCERGCWLQLCPQRNPKSSAELAQNLHKNRTSRTAAFRTLLSWHSLQKKTSKSLKPVKR